MISKDGVKLCRDDVGVGGENRGSRVRVSARQLSYTIFCIPSRAAFGVASRDPVPVADRSRRERVDGLIGTDEPFDFDP